MPNANEIFNYVMNSPENTNPAVLRGMLNSIEGGGGGALVVHVDRNGTLDKTWREIRDAADNMPLLIVTTSSGVGTDAIMIGYIVAVGSHVGTSSYYVAAGFPDTTTNPIEWTKGTAGTKSEDGYPVFED